MYKTGFSRLAFLLLSFLLSFLFRGPRPPPCLRAGRSGRGALNLVSLPISLSTPQSPAPLWSFFFHSLRCPVVLSSLTVAGFRFFSNFIPKMIVKRSLYRTGCGPVKAPQPVWGRQTPQGQPGPSAAYKYPVSSPYGPRCYAGSARSDPFCVGEGASELDADATDSVWQMQCARSLLFANGGVAGVKQRRTRRVWERVKKGLRKVCCGAGRLLAGKFLLDA